MSGIFKGDSIYKNGGGGGGYKDGGELVDGDFIEVKNNTVSSYDNVSRDPINFYFEVKEGEILNSVVELTTAVNSTVYVYVIKNGIYYLLGNVGGDTVNAGEDYKVNITGDSYSIEQVSGGLIPAYLDFDGKNYALKKIGDLYWTTENIVANASAFGISGYWPIGKPNPQSTYPGYFYGITSNDQYQTIKNKIKPFRIPTYSDYSNLKVACGDDTNAAVEIGWSHYPTATNISGFSAKPCGNYNLNSGVSLQGSVVSLLYVNPDSSGKIPPHYGTGTCGLSPNTNFSITSSYNSSMGILRLCIDV